jgi:hypothetical protein
VPNRILREGILTSPRVSRLGGWASEVFYRRLMSVVDDYGRYYADSGLLRAACYPRQLNKVSDADIGKWLSECETAALVSVYPASDGERYLQLLDFRQQTRAAKSRFPDPSSECIATATQTLSRQPADAPVFGDGDVIGDGDGKARKRATPPNPGVDPQVWDDWLALRKAKRAPVTQTVIDGATTEAQKAGMSLESFLRIWCRRGSQGLEAAWLKPEEKAQSFAERATAAKAARLAEMTGGMLGAVQPGAKGAVIDMEVPNAPRLTA